jgi:hypothetical protein
MTFGMMKWLDAQEAEQIALEEEMASLRRFATTAAHHAALDEMLEQAKEIRTRINFRRKRLMMMKATTAV